MKKTPRVSYAVQGILYMTLAALIGSLVSASVKHMLVIMTPLLVFWLSRIFPLAGLIPLLLKEKPNKLRTRHIWNHIILNIFYVGSVGSYFYSMGFIPMVDATLLFYSAPLYTPLLSFLLIRETFPARLWGYIFLSFLGVLLVLQPGSELFRMPSLIAAFSGLFMAIAQVYIRRLTRYESPYKIVFYMILFAPILSSFAWLFFPELLLPIPSQLFTDKNLLLQLILMGIGTWLYQLYRSKAVARTKVGIVMPFSYTAIVFTGMLDWAFWGVVPNLLSAIGIILVCIGSFALLKSCKKA